MKLRASLAILALALATASVAAFAAPANAAKPGSSGSVSTAADGVTQLSQLPVTGTFTITKFKNVNGVLTAFGTFTGSVNGNATTPAWAPVTAANGTALSGARSLAVPAASGTCEILTLTLGPLHLDLLGLVVDLNQVDLHITAQQGSGNLLGNLLCAVTGLLDGNTGLSGLLNQLSALLNQILGQL